MPTRRSLLLAALTACIGAASAPAAERIVVAGGDSFVPGMFINADGEADGTDADLWRLWSQKTGVEIEFRLMPWPETIPQLLAGKVDVVDGVSYTAEREKILDFTEPYNIMTVLIYFHESVEGIRSIKDLSGFPVGVLAGSNTLAMLQTEGPGIKPIPYVAPEEMITAAIDGRIRVFVCEQGTVGYYFAKLGGREHFRHAETPLLTSDLRMAVRKDESATLELVERGISLITPEERQDITETWTGVGLRIEVPWREIGTAAAVAFVVVALLVAWNAALQRRVAKVTRTLRESEHNYRTIFNATNEAIFIHDAATGAIVDVNDRMCQMYGYARDEAVGMPIEDFSSGTPPYTQSDALAVLLRAVEGEPQVFEWHAKRKGGGLFWVEVALRSTDIGGEGRVLAVVRDIAARKRAEAEREEFETRMRQTQKLESLGVLTGGIAHDFNNLLTVILGNADLVLEDMEEDSRFRRMLSEIKKTSLQAADLCQQMLAYAGRGRLVMTRVDLTAVVRDMQQMLGVSVSKKATLMYEFTDGLSEVQADVSQVRQVIMNLVINASEALDESPGQITIRTGQMWCDEPCLRAAEPLEDRAEGTYAYVEVADGGAGMDPQARERIFDPFYTTKFAGRGLGLAAVHGIVRGHKGIINVESTPGEGSTLRVLFPVAQSGAQAERPSGSPPADAAAGDLSGTVLVIDDEESVRMVARGMLERLGLKSLLAGNGDEGLREFEEHADDIALVLLDLNMPVMDGEECYRRIRALRPDARVVLCSGYDELSTAPRFEGLGLAAFLKKPYLFAQFRDILTRVMG